MRNHTDRIVRTLIILGAVVLSLGAAEMSFSQVVNNNVYTPSDYTTFQPPARGGSYTDAVFTTAIKRLSDSMTMMRTDTGGTLGSVTPEYSTMSPFNIDNTRVLLLHFSYFGLYDGSGNYLRDLPMDISASSQPRWSKSDPNVIYYIHGNQLKQYNAGSDVTTVVRAFTEYSAISGAGESDISFDGRRLVLAGDTRNVFVYDIANDTRGAVLDTGGRGYDSLYITDNFVTVTWNSAGTGRYQGIELFDANMVFQRQLTRAGGHMDVSRDTNGDDILLWTNSADPTPICNNGIVKVRFSDGQQSCLLELDWSLAVHISAPDGAGFVFVETYSPSDIIPPTGWKKYTDEFLQIKLDGSEVRRLAHHRSRPLNGYTYMPKISTSHDGSKLIFGSNFGLQAQKGLPGEYSDVYMIDLGNGAAAPIPNAAPPAAPVAPQPIPVPAPAVKTRVEQNGNGVAMAGSWMPNGNGVHSGGSAILAMDAGSRVIFSFNGTGANWIGYTDEWSGIAQVTVDGIARGEVDTYKAPGKAQDVVYSVTGLAAGNHTLTIEAAGRRNAASGGSWIWIDAFEAISDGNASVLPLAPPPPAAPAIPVGLSYHVEQTDPAVKFSGNWSSNNNGSHNGGSAMLSMDAGSKVSFTFTGTSVSWTAYRDQWSGMARVTVDGVFKGDLDTYAGADSPRTKIFSVTCATWGTHTITIEALGTHGPSSAGSWIWIDAFDYFGSAQ